MPDPIQTDQRLQTLLQGLEAAYGSGPTGPPAAAPVAPVAKPVVGPPAPGPDPRMQMLLQNLDSAYPSSFQFVKGEPPPAPDQGGPGVLGTLGQVVHTVGAGGYQGLAGWVDTADKVYDQLLKKEYQAKYEAISNAPVPGQEKMTTPEIQAAKMKMFDELGPFDQWLQKRKIPLIANARDFLLKQAQAHAEAGIPMTDNKAMEVIRKVYQASGQAGVDVPIYAAGGPASLPVFGAAKAYGETGTPEGAVMGGVEGALTQGMIHAVGLLPSAVQLPTWFGMGAAITPGNLQDRVVGGLTWAGLGLTGKGKDNKVTVGEFISRYPKWQKRVDDTSALKVLQAVAPEITPEYADQNGGAKAVLDKAIAAKDRFATIMEVFKGTGQDPEKLTAMLNNPDYAPLFRDLMNAETPEKPALPPARPETVAAATPARFQATETGNIVGANFPEDQLIKIRLREQELGRQLTPDEVQAVINPQAPKAPEAPAAAVAAPAAEAKPPARDALELQMMTPEDAAKLDQDEFKNWANPRFRMSYDPTNKNDMAAFNDLVKALGLRGDTTVLEDVKARIKAPEKPPEQPPPAAVPPAAAPTQTPPPATPEATLGINSRIAEQLQTKPGDSPAMVAQKKKALADITATHAEIQGIADQSRAMVEAAAQAAKPKAPAPKAEKAVSSTPLLSWILKKGGVNLDSLEFVHLKGEAQPFLETIKGRKYFRRKGGESVEHLAEEAAGDGRIAEPSTAALIEAMNNEYTGSQTHPSRDEMNVLERGRPGQEGIQPEYEAQRETERFNAEQAGKKDLLAQAEQLRDSGAKDENSVKQMAEGLLAQTGFDDKDVKEFKANTFMDGDEAKKVARAFAEGRMSTDQAVEKLRGMVRDAVTPEAAAPAPEALPPEETPKPVAPPEEFKLTQEAAAKPKAPAPVEKPLMEPGKVERTMPAGFDNRGLKTWADMEDMRREVLPLVNQGWTAEYGRNADGNVWARLKERKAAGEGELQRGEVKTPKFGEHAAEQMGLPEGYDAALPLEKAPPAHEEAQTEVGKVESTIRKKGAPQTEEDKAFEDEYKRMMDEYDQGAKATPEGKEKVFRAYSVDPYGVEDDLGNFEESLRPDVEAYLKKKGLDETQIRLGPMFNGTVDAGTSTKDRFGYFKDVADYTAEVGDQYTETAKKGGPEKPPEGETEVFAGLAPPKSVRQAMQKLGDKFDVEAPFKRIKAAATGLALKLYHPRRNAEIDQGEIFVRQLSKKYKLKPEDFQEVTSLAFRPNKLYTLSEADQARLGPVVKEVRDFLDRKGEELRKAGIVEEPWPYSAIHRMKEEKANLEQALERGVKNPGKVHDQIEQLNGALTFLEKSGVKYVPIPRFWMERFFSEQGDKAPKILNEFFRQRKSLDMEGLSKYLLENNYIKPTDLDIRRIIMGYEHQLGHKLALADIFRQAKNDGLILPADEAPDTWQSLHPRRFPTLRGMKANPVLVDYIERNFLRPGWSNPVVGSILGPVKMLQFYNPLNLSQYSVIHTAWSGALTSLKAPGAFHDAFKAFRERNADYWEAYHWGAFGEPFTPSFRQAEKRIRTLISDDPVLVKVAKSLNPYKWSWNLAWEMHNYFNMTAYEYLKSKGFTPKDAAQIAAKTGGDYASLPPATRKVINKILFTPTFTISMAKTQGEMLANGAKILFNPKLLTAKGEGPMYTRQMAKGFLLFLGGIMLREQLMHKMGFQTDKFGLKYMKEYTDEDGNNHQLVVHMASPDNVILRYVYDLQNVAAADNKVDALYQRAKWKIHPIWQLAAEVLGNRTGNNEPIRDPWDTRAEAIKKTALYAIRRVIRVTELLPEAGPGALSKEKAMSTLTKEVGWLGGTVLSAFSIPYIRSPEERQLAYQMNNMLNVFKQANRAVPTTDPDETERRMTWLRSELDKIRTKMEEVK